MNPGSKIRWRTCLKNLWHCARAYNQSVPLPSFVHITLASPKITRRLRTKMGDLTDRVIRCCVLALIVNKLADDFQSHISFGGGLYDAELACISSILSTEPSEFLHRPRPSAVVKLQNVVSLVSGEIKTLFTSGTTGTPAEYCTQSNRLSTSSAQNLF